MAVYKGDVGTVLEIDVGEDVSTVDTKEIFLKKPDASTTTKTAVFKTDGTDGIIQYTFTAAEIDQTGTWSVQGHLVFGANDWATAIGTFTVSDRLVTA